MTDWKAQARELAIWIQVMDIGVCQDPDCKECKFVVDEVAAALERAAAQQREKDARICDAQAQMWRNGGSDRTFAARALQAETDAAAIRSGL